MKKILLLPMLFTTILLTGSCTFNNVYLNREEDNREGKAFLTKFYSNIGSKNYGAVDSLISDSLKLLAGPGGISKMIKFINSKVGNYKGYFIDDRYIRRVTGSNNQTSYNYKLKVTYDKGVIDEIIGFKKENGSAIKINSYHANSDLLIK